MFELFKAELLRFRLWAGIAGVAHLITLGFMSRIVDMAQQPLLVHWSFGVVYAAIALLLGLYQMGTYRRPNAWVNLLHRPLSPPRIASALLLAGVVLLAIVIALPILLIALWQETMTARVVDLRHWLLALAALQIGCAGYLAGACGMLGERRYSASALVFLLLLVSANATGFGALALQAVVVAWLAAMVYATFKPDLDAPPRGIAGLAVVALPLQMAVYLMIMLVYAGTEFAWIAQGSHPNNTPTPPHGGHNEPEKVDERTRMRLALEGGTHPDTALLREQIALSEPLGITSQVRREPQRNELANVAPMEFDDESRGVRWVFSHDDMRFHGYRLADRSAAGTLGVGRENAPLQAPALPVGGMRGLPKGDSVLLAGNIAYQYISAEKRLMPRIVLPRGEVIAGAGPLGETLGVLSDSALYLYDSREAVEHHRPMTARKRVTIPGAYHDIYNLDLIELVDGHLVVFTNSYGAHGMESAAPRQYTVRTREDGGMETIADRPLSYDYPAAYRYQWFFTSPAMYGLRRAALDLFAPERPFERTRPPPIPRSMWTLAAILSLLSTIGAALRLRGLELSRPARLAWLAACAAIGLPALGALWLLYRPRKGIAPAT